jgi:hypothetical protein
MNDDTYDCTLILSFRGVEQGGCEDVSETEW